MITCSTAKRNAAKKNDSPVLPPEIVDEILLWTGDAKLVYALGKFWLMKKLKPATFWDIVQVPFRMMWPELMNDGEMEAYIENLKSKPANLADWAAISGRLRYLKYLTENTDYVGTIDGMNYSARWGHLEVVQFLHRGLHY